MTIKEVISRVNLPETINDSIMYRWLGELDKKTYKYPDDADTELAIKDADIYEKYLIAMIDFCSGDLKAYQKSAIEFQLAYEERLECR